MKKILRSCIFAVMAIALLPAGTLAQERRMYWNTRMK